MERFAERKRDEVGCGVVGGYRGLDGGVNAMELIEIFPCISKELRLSNSGATGQLELRTCTLAFLGRREKPGREISQPVHQHASRPQRPVTKHTQPCKGSRRTALLFLFSGLPSCLMNNLRRNSSQRSVAKHGEEEDDNE